MTYEYYYGIEKCFYRTVIECRAVWSRERCLSVCPSVKHVDCDKTEKNLSRFYTI